MGKPGIVLATCLMLLVVFSAQAAMIRVPGDYPTIQAGIDAAADGDTVLVADGIYTGAGNKNLDFKGKAITVSAENGAESTIIDCEGAGRGFYFHSRETSESVVSGFTIKNGSPGSGFIGENPIQIALSAETGEKMVDVDVEKDTLRSRNDGDVAVEPGEVMGLSITLKNTSTDPITSVTVVLKTTDTRVVGLRMAGTELAEVDMTLDGIRLTTFAGQLL